MKQKVAMLLSGGVDSSVALAALVEQGYEVEAFYLKIWLEDELSFLGDCPWQEDVAYAESVCKRFNVPLHIIPLQKEYHERIVSYTIDEVKAGRTPSPDVLCNRRIKFGVFFDHIGSEFEKVASGHYAQVMFNDATQLYELHTAPDPVKDQTSFLSHLTQQQLSRILFPIGHMQKYEVRAKAEQYNLLTKDRKDSQGICFLGKISFRDFVKHYLGTRSGNIVEFETNNVIGLHDGFWFYTVGQRKGLGLSGGPWYVVNKDVDQNIVYVSRHYHDDEKERNTFLINDMHWISGLPSNKQELAIKVRHGAHYHSGSVTYYADGRISVILAQRDQGLAPGQFAVFYNDTCCLGSGIISSESAY